MATVAEKDELIREKEVEIDELRVSFYIYVYSDSHIRIDCDALG